MMKKLAIVSSYNEDCGNASYTEALRREFSKYYDVDVIPLKLNLLQSNYKKKMILGNRHIDDICNKLKSYDYVNIQFEAGLYGNSRDEIIARTKKLIRSSNNVIVTMHRIDVPKGIFDRDVANSFLSKRLPVALKEYRRNNYFAHIYPKIATEVYRHNKEGKGNIIVHTKRDRENIKMVFGVPCVYDHPLAFLSMDELKRKRDRDEVNLFKKRYGLKVDDIAIGIFGFVTEYKGHGTAIKALNYLPENYKLLIFGSQHPSSIIVTKEIDRFEEKLLNIIDKDKLDERVHFCGNLDDEHFINALYCCDFSVLPYMEVNQSGSGIASLALETGIPSLFSNNKAFAELKKYFPGCFEQFDIGNYMELAYKIETYQDKYSQNREKALKKYNIESNVGLYRRLFEGE